MERTNLIGTEKSAPFHWFLLTVITFHNWELTCVENPISFIFFIFIFFINI